MKKPIHPDQHERPLPKWCPDHPEAPAEHTWVDRGANNAGLVNLGCLGIRGRKHRCHCFECGRKLDSDVPEEAK